MSTSLGERLPLLLFSVTKPYVDYQDRLGTNVQKLDVEEGCLNEKGCDESHAPHLARCLHDHPPSSSSRARCYRTRAATTANTPMPPLPACCLSACIFICPSICPSTYLPVYLFICPSTYLPVYLFICLSIYLSACLLICLSIYLSID